MHECNLYVKYEVLPITSTLKTGCIERLIEEPAMLNRPLAENTSI